MNKKYQHVNIIYLFLICVCSLAHSVSAAVPEESKSDPVYLFSKRDITKHAKDCTDKVNLSHLCDARTNKKSPYYKTRVWELTNPSVDDPDRVCDIKITEFQHLSQVIEHHLTAARNPHSFCFLETLNFSIAPFHILLLGNIDSNYACHKDFDQMLTCFIHELVRKETINPIPAHLKLLEGCKEYATKKK